MRNLIGFQPTVIHEEYNSSDSPVDILSVEEIFFESYIPQGTIFPGKRSSIIHNWTMTVDPGYEHIENFAGVISCFMMESKGFRSKISFGLKNENGHLVSFDCQSLTF